MSKLEQQAREAWARWGEGYMKYTACAACGTMHHCRSKAGKRFICLDCFDQGKK